MYPTTKSATAHVFASGVYTTSTPRLRQAATSMFSSPTPPRPTTRNFGALASIASFTRVYVRTTIPAGLGAVPAPFANPAQQPDHHVPRRSFRIARAQTQNDLPVIHPHHQRPLNLVEAQQEIRQHRRFFQRVYVSQHGEQRVVIVHR